MASIFSRIIAGELDARFVWRDEDCVAFLSNRPLRPGHTLRLVVVPQAMRVIIPPLTNQYLNLTKNSSLAVAIGYPDLVSVFAGTTLSQTGQAIEIIGITMGVYLLISLVTSAIMSFYGWRLGRGMS